MLCRNCGRDIVEGSRFCAECGMSATGSHQPPASPPDPLIGTTIEGKYRLDSKIGAGGMAAVYRATRLLIGDLVAVKILHAEQFRDAQAPERFRREAQAAARLKHPNAVTIHDFGVSSEGQVYLVMELVEGQSLRAIVKDQGPFLPSAAADIMAQVCAAVDEAHRQNIVHRDLKPDNVIATTTPNGVRVKVLDFGIARLRDMSGIANLTQTGSVMGTPHYMSPEQCLGEELDGRSDIYSLGVMLYEMLAGIVPFNSPTSMAVVVQHVNSTPAPLRVLNVSISPAVEAVVMRALEKRRDARPQTAGALAGELTAALSGTTLPISAPATGSVTGADTRASRGMMATVQIATPWTTAAAPPGPARTSTLPPRHAVGQQRKSQQRVLIAGGLVAVVTLTAGLGRMLLFNKRETPASDVATTAPVPVAASEIAMATSEQGGADSVPAEVPEPAGQQATPLAPPQETAPAGVTLGSVPAAPRSAAAAAPIAGGGLTVRSQPGSTVLVDGSAVGTTGSEGVLVIPRLQPGRHLLAVRRTGFRQEERTINFTGQSDVLTVELATLPGQISVTASTPGATFQVDGEGSYLGQISGLELPIGRHQVTATKTGFRPASIDVDLRPGEVFRSTMTLDALSTVELLSAIENEYRAGNFEAAASGARLVLTSDPRQPKATLILGQSFYRQNKFSESVASFGSAIDLGEQVVLPIKHHHAGFPSDGLCTGVVTLSKSNFAFQSTTSSGHDFNIPANKILEIKNEPLKAARINIKIAVANGNKEDKKDFNFQNAGADLYRSSETSSIVAVRCFSCDDSMSVLYALLVKIRGQ